MILTGPAGQTVEVVLDDHRLVVLFPDMTDEQVQELLEETPTRAWWRLERTRKNIPGRDVRRWAAAGEFLWRPAEDVWDEAVAGLREAG